MDFIPLLPLAICKKLKSFVCSLSPPSIATLNQDHAELLKNFLPQEFIAVEPIIISEEVFHHHILHQERQEEIQALCQCIRDDENLAIQKLLLYFLTQATKLNASDIHFQSLEEHVSIKMRIDGELFEFSILESEIFSLLSSLIKLECLLDIHEKRKPQDGRFGKVLDGKSYDFRVSSVPTIKGESLVIRILYKQTKEMSLEELGFRLDFKSLLNIPHGLIFVTGPTGSGKSTTLYSMLHALKDTRKKIITIEDPIEYDVPHLTQVAINEKYGFGFQEALRSILRQDPDIIMVGEIRDEPTLSLAIRASLTGHLVLCTLHTNDALSTIERLLDMKAQPYLIASTLHLIISQRLLPRLCPHCKIPLPPPFNYLPEPFREQEFFESTGCEQCQYKGFKHRILVYESLLFTPKLKSSLRTSSLSLPPHFPSLFLHALTLASKGEIALHEALRLENNRI